MKKFVIVILCGIVIFLIVGVLSPHPCKDMVEKQLTFGTGNDEGADIVRAANGTLYAAWMTDRVNTQIGENANMVMAKSTDNGKTWSAPWTILDSPYNDFGGYFIQAKDGTFYVPMWRQAPGTHQSDIWFVSSKDTVTWSAPKAVTNDTYEDIGGMMREDAKGNLWIIWSSMRTGNMDVFIARSWDKGNTWSAPIQITNHPFHDEMATFAIVDGTFYAAWARVDPGQTGRAAYLNYLSNDTELYYATSADGITWSDPIAVTNDTGSHYVDTLPVIYKRADGKYYLSWITTRFNPMGEVHQVPLLDLPSIKNHVRLKGVGYSMDNIALDNGSDMMVWTEERKSGDGINRDGFYRIIPPGCTP